MTAIQLEHEIALPLIPEDLSVGERIINIFDRDYPYIHPSQFGTIESIEGNLIRILMDDARRIDLQEEDHFPLRKKIQSWRKPLQLAELYWGATISRLTPEGREYGTITGIDFDVKRMVFKSNASGIKRVYEMNYHAEEVFMDWVLEA